MTDSTLEPVSSPAMSLGQCLHAAREQQQLSLDDVSRQLKYSVRQLAALEADDYSAFPSRVLLQGVVRSYGKMLGLAPAQLQSLLAPILPDDTPQRIVPQYEGTRFQEATRPSQVRVWPFLVGGVAALVVGGALYVGSQGRWSGKLLSSPAPEPAASQVPAAADGAIPLTVPADVEADRAASEAPGAETLPETGASSAVAAGEGELELVANDAAWIDVRDARGNKLYSQLLPAGQTQRLQGEPPYRVKIGNAAKVGVRFRGQAVDLTPNIRSNVARLELK